MIPIVLINLLIGVSTGELTQILAISDLTQYNLRLNFILWTQKFMLKWKGERWCKENILFNEYKAVVKKKEKDHIFAENNNEKDIAFILKQFESRFNVLVKLFVELFFEF